MDKLCTVSKTRPGAQCGSDCDLFITKFRLKLKKVGKTTRPFRYDLNHQIPYHYTVKGTNRFKGSDLVDRVPGELWTNQVHNVGQEVVTKIIRKTKKGKKAKWLSEEHLQTAEKRRDVRGGKIYPTECRVPEHSKER